MRVLLLPLLILGASAATTLTRNEMQVARTLAGLVPGKPVSCLPTRQTSQLQADNNRLLYRVSRNLVYVNQTSGGCGGVARGDILITVSQSGGLCRGDLARTVSAGSRLPSGSCALGDFTPYRAPR